MKLLRRHKFILAGLALYWPFLFFLTHMKMPAFVGRLGMTDKTMHYMAFMLLTFFVWYAISPYKRVNWRSFKPWLVIAVVVGYGIVDEILQARVGRNPEIGDIVADLLGAVTGLVIQTVFTFWSALLGLATLAIFIITNKSDIIYAFQEYHSNTVFSFFAYSIMTLIWIQHMSRFQDFERPNLKWLLTAISLPVGLLAVVCGAAQFFHRQMNMFDVYTGCFGIGAVVMISYVTFKITKSYKL